MLQTMNIFDMVITKTRTHRYRLLESLVWSIK